MRVSKRPGADLQKKGNRPLVGPYRAFAIGQE
jgi:hypothetical protein